MDDGFAPLSRERVRGCRVLAHPGQPLEELDGRLLEVKGLGLVLADQLIVSALVANQATPFEQLVDHRRGKRAAPLGWVEAFRVQLRGNFRRALAPPGREARSFWIRGARIPSGG